MSEGADVSKPRKKKKKKKKIFLNYGIDATLVLKKSLGKKAYVTMSRHGV